MTGFSDMSGIGHRNPPAGLRFQVPVGRLVAPGRCALIAESRVRRHGEGRGGLRAMKKVIVGCLILVFLATPGAAQTQPPSAPPQRTAPHPPAPPPATPPPAAFYCLFEGKEYSIGAVLCVSSQMSQVCSASDSEHARAWWSSGPQSLCAASSAARAAVDAPYARAPGQSPIPAQPSIPKNTP
jgi:hypothetical protein